MVEEHEERRSGARSLGPLELQLMDAVWDASGPLSVQEVVDLTGPDRNYKTVMTVLNRLVGKELLERELDGRAYRYRATQPRAAYLRSAADELVHAYVRAYGKGSAAHLADAVGAHVPPPPPPNAGPLPVVRVSPPAQRPAPRVPFAALVLGGLLIEAVVILLARRGGGR